jgi:hypothetical protein
MVPTPTLAGQSSDLVGSLSKSVVSSAGYVGIAGMAVARVLQLFLLTTTVSAFHLNAFPNLIYEKVSDRIGSNDSYALRFPQIHGFLKRDDCPSDDTLCPGTGDPPTVFTQLADINEMVAG